MKARDVATRMRSIEDNITGETGEDAPPLTAVVTTLLDLEPDDIHDVLIGEIERVKALIADWYAKMGIERAPESYAGLGFVQGITFAVAAQRLREDGET